MLQGIPELRLVHQTIHDAHIISLLLKGSKHPIPNDQHCSIILIQTVSVRPMMNLMIIIYCQQNVLAPTGALGLQMSVPSARSYL